MQSPQPKLASRALIGACAALTLVGVVGLVLGARDRVAAHGSSPKSSQWRTPILSIRRVPGVLRNASARQRLEAAVRQALSAPDLAGALGRSCVVVRAAGGLVTVLNPTLAVMPASTLKVLTAVAALARIGADERFTTSVRSPAPAVAGALKGDLWFVGGGDPLLETADYTATQVHDPESATSLEKLADAVVAGGIRSVEGAVVGDDRRYDAVRLLPTWKRSYLTSGEVGPIGALMVNDNFTVVAAGTRRAASDVPADAAAIFQTLLEARGVTFGRSSRGATSADVAASSVAPNVVAEVQSVPLHDVLSEMMRWSDNTTAEMIVKELGLRSTGTGSTAAGVEAIRSSLSLRGVDVRSMRTVDGSGLDRSDRLTCKLLADAVALEPANGPFMDSLPVMGRSGTLRRRLRASSATGKVRAKTGTLSDVSSLAGRADGTDGSSIEFALVFNGLRSSSVGVQAGNTIAEALVSFPDAPTTAQLGPE